MVQTVLVLVRSSLLGAAIWTGLVRHWDWLPLGMLAVTTAWSLATIVVRRRIAAHDRARLVRELARASRPTAAGLRSRVLPAGQEPLSRQAR